MNTILFGAFDRHNLGDILLARVAEREVEGPAVFAGLAARDLRSHGGVQVVPLATAVAGAPVRLIHVGGELLDCDTAQAAYMLGERKLELARQCAYVVAKGGLPAGSRVEFRAVGGVAVAGRPAVFRDEVLAALAQADALSVRDAVTRGFLSGNGIRADLMPDPVSRVADLFGDEIRARRPAARGYLAVQFAAEWGDDGTLASLARGIDRLALRVVLFRAGAAPWHDDLEPYRRLAKRLKVPATIFESLDAWGICGLVAGAARVVATSLHVRIVADAFGVPVISLEQRPGAALKLGAYLANWRPQAPPVALEEFAEGA